MDLHCIHSPDIFFTGGNILCKTPQKKRGLDDYVFMYICMLYVYICSINMYVCEFACVHVYLCMCVCVCTVDLEIFML